MPRTRRTIPIDEKIAAQEAKVQKLQERLAKETEKLKALQVKKAKGEKKDLFDMLLNSGKSVEEIKSFLEQ